MKRHEQSYRERLKERLERVPEDEDYARLKERASAPYDWALVIAFSPGDNSWPSNLGHSVRADRLGAA